MTVVQRKEFAPPPVDRQEILRYALCRQPDDAALEMLERCLDAAAPVLSYRVCWMEVPVTVTGNTCDFGIFSLSSRRLALHLRGCKKAVIFAATIGLEMDRLIAKFGRLSPAMGLWMQAVGTERVEALCDTFCAELKSTRPRFSPGYGDLKLSAQTVIFDGLDCPRQIGLTLNDSYIMSPSKSVTAIVGLD